MSFVLLSDKLRAAKKIYACIWCGERINIGDIYLHRKGIHDGVFMKDHWHPECYRFSVDMGDGEFASYSNDRPEVEEKA